jgi:trypsin
MMLIQISLVLALAAVCYAQPPSWYAGTCGRSKYADAGEMPLPPLRRGMIVGGQEARPFEFPWQVSMRTKQNAHYCGGSIINQLWIVTASHCVDGDTPNQVLIVVGDHKRDDASNTFRQSINVVQIHMHPNYDSRNLYNDVAVVKLATPITFNENVQPVCAPDSANLYTYRLSQCAGWGTLSSGGSCCPQTLQYVTLNVTTNDFCQAEYTNDDISVDMICATDNTGSNQRDSCQGDSGGPLTVKNSDGSFALVGIVSWGIGCASGYPGVYGRVGEFNTWITNTINSN